ncbi:MAG: glycosyltransferase [Actinomycetia bacterium]|nr:glycosyltransferase [Actinomycetes bacterium]
MTEPSVTIMLPVYNEIDAIEESMTSLLAQDYSGPLEIIITDGGSTDGTREYLDTISDKTMSVAVIDNPLRRQSHGLNQAASAAASTYLTRADGHTIYAHDYVSRSVDVALETNAACGGTMKPVGTTWFSRCVAAAMNSRLTMGPARFHHAQTRETVDTVYLGTFLKTDFLAIGGFRALPSGAAEDADFYARWRASGRKVVVDPAIRSTYEPRGRPGALWRQYYRYGLGKAEMLWLNGAFPSWRPLAPLGFVVALTGTITLGVFGISWIPIAVLGVAWTAVVAYGARHSGRYFPGVIAAAAIMHISYGIGVASGLIRGPSRLADVDSTPSQEIS